MTGCQQSLSNVPKDKSYVKGLELKAKKNWSYLSDINTNTTCTLKLLLNCQFLNITEEKYNLEEI
jgi:hypothetical protein